MKKNFRARERGAINGAIIGLVLLVLAVLALAGVSIWLYNKYEITRTDVQGQIDTAVAKAQKSQADSDEMKFAEREKEPNRQFVGPDDYGRVTLSYPKTWSAYVAQTETQGGDYRAYFNPVYVPPVSTQQRFALRLLIQNEDYDQVVSTYDSRVKTGDLKSSGVSVNGQGGTRLDGKFSQTIRGSVVIFKLRDKTVSVFTDANTFVPDFNSIVKSIKFNQ